MRKTDRKLGAVLAACMLLTLLPMAALAQEAEPAHDHTGWTAVTMGTSYIKLGDTEQSSNTLSDGNYYLDGDITVPLTISGAVSLCLNNHSVTVSSNSDAVKVESGSSLTLCDCVTDSTGKIAYTGTYSTSYGIRNNGNLTLNSGAVEGAYRGVYNDSNSTFTMTGGSVTGGSGTSGYGVFNGGTFTMSGGSVSGGQYGIYNDSRNNTIYLSGSPSISGGTAGIYTSGNSSKLYADDGGLESAVPYSGAAITLAYSSPSYGNTAVYHVTDATKDKFTFTHNNYTLEFAEVDATLQFQGKPQELTWYGDDDQPLTGDAYPESLPYYTYLESSDLPNPPEVEGKIFLGWRYKEGDAANWSTGYWSGSSIYNATDFKADYIDSFTGGGSGTADDPYQIATAADLQTLATLIDKGVAAYNNSAVWYRLTADIDLSGVCGEGNNWTPIGRSDYNSYSFKANLDGNGTTISNLYINTSSTSYQGLFYKLDGATVKNLTITGSVTAGSYYGALAGYIQGSTVENVDVTGVTLTPYGYTTDAHRTMAHKTKSGNTIDIQGNYKNNWIKTTYSNDGYEVATANLTGATVSASAEFVNGGRYIQLSYTVTAGETAIEGGKLAVHADIMIGDNDKAAVEVIQDADGEVIGLKMVDTHTVEAKPECISRDAQFNLYFDGTGGVTPVDTYWFGYYGNRQSHCYDQLDDSTKSSGTYEQVDGVYTRLTDTDSGFAVSWQNIDLEPNQSRTYSFILGVGEKADPPQWSGENAVSLTLDADAAQDRRLVNVSAKVKDAAGLTDTLYYGVDGGDGEVLGEVTADGSVKDITGRLDLSDYQKGSYIFTFWVVNSKGAASAAVERTITITADGIWGMDGDGDAPEHTHAWAEDWTTSATHHWHECAGEGTCDMTSDSGKDGYGEHTKAWVSTDAAQHWENCATCGWTGEKTAHVYDNDADTTCNTCGYVRTVAPTYSISGTVKDHESNPVAAATVKLMKGREQIGGSVTTDAQGRYAFTDVAPGSYNVVATKGDKTMTILVKVTNADLTEQNLSMPGENVNSVLDVKDTTVSADAAADVTKVVVGGLEAVAEAVKTTETGATSVTVTMTVEAKEESAAANAGAIQAAATGKTLEYLDIKVEQKVVTGASEAITSVTDTGDTVIEIVVPFNFSGKAADSVTVYRYHGDSAAPLEKTDTKARGTFRLDTAGGLIHIYATMFSTYAIGYTPEGGGDSGGGDSGGGDSGGGYSSATYPVAAPASTPNGAVKLSSRNAGRGTTVTITATPDEGYEISGVTVTDVNGKEIAVTSKGNGIYTFIMPVGKVTVNTVFVKITDGYKNCPKNDTCPIWPYTDISAEAWYHDGVHYCIENGLMAGYGDNIFKPESDTSRAMIATILWRLEGRPVVNSILPFDDVAEGAWYAEAVRWAASCGAVSGYGDGKFGPNDPITREQLAAMLYRYEQYKGGGFTGAWMFPLNHADAGLVSSWAYEPICWTTMNGIINGVGNGLLDPEGKATRAQAAAMIMRFCEKA